MISKGKSTGKINGNNRSSKFKISRIIGNLRLKRSFFGSNNETVYSYSPDFSFYGLFKDEKTFSYSWLPSHLTSF